MVRLTRVNTALLVAIVVVNLITIALPLWPAVGFWWQAEHSAAATLEQQRKVLHTTKPTKLAAADDRIIIPSMLLDQQLHEGRDERTLNKGLWVRPQGSTPDKGGNTVIVGHRFTYTNPRGTLYHLDKVKPGDAITLTWKNKVYDYTVQRTQVVKANASHIEDNTKTPTLTIYTCTPLWNPVDRLVVTATLNKEKP